MIRLLQRARSALYGAIFQVTIRCGFRYLLVQEFPNGTREELARLPWLFPLVNGAMGAQAEIQRDARAYDGSTFKVIDMREGRS